MLEVDYMMKSLWHGIYLSPKTRLDLDRCGDYLAMKMLLSCANNI